MSQGLDQNYEENCSEMTMTYSLHSQWVVQKSYVDHGFDLFELEVLASNHRGFIYMYKATHPVLRRRR
jgi:hypothetical protein